MKFTWSAFLAAFAGALAATIIFTVGFKLLFKEKIDADGIKRTSFVGQKEEDEE